MRFSTNGSPKTLVFGDVKKDITPSEIVFYMYLHSEMWKTIHFCCCRATAAAGQQQVDVITYCCSPRMMITTLVNAYDNAVLR